MYPWKQQCPIVRSSDFQSLRLAAAADAQLTHLGRTREHIPYLAVADVEIPEGNNDSYAHEDRLKQVDVWPVQLIDAKAVFFDMLLSKEEDGHIAADSYYVNDPFLPEQPRVAVHKQEVENRTAILVRNKAKQHSSVRWLADCRIKAIKEVNENTALNYRVGELKNHCIVVTLPPDLRAPLDLYCPLTAHTIYVLHAATPTNIAAVL